MPKWLLYGLAAVVDLVLAYIFYLNDRFVIPVILVFAGLLMAIAAAGAALGKGGAKGGTSA